MFGLPVLLLSPFFGRQVDRRGSLAFIIIGSILPAIMGLAYTRITDPVLAVPMILIEATGFAMLNPALYAVVAANSPLGRTSTAQGIFGAAGTVGFIVASLTAGVIAADQHHLSDVRLQRGAHREPRASASSSAGGASMGGLRRHRPSPKRRPSQSEYGGSNVSPKASPSAAMSRRSCSLGS